MGGAAGGGARAFDADDDGFDVFGDVVAADATDDDAAAFDASVPFDSAVGVIDSSFVDNDDAPDDDATDVDDDDVAAAAGVGSGIGDGDSDDAGAAAAASTAPDIIIY